MSTRALEIDDTRSTPPTPARRGRKELLTVLAALLVAVLLGALVAVALGPRASLSHERTGDPALVRDTEAAAGAGRGLQSLSVARIEKGATTFAGLGTLKTTDGEKDSGAPTPHTRYELGSITKTFTGMLLADAVKRGEMKLDAPLSTYLPELAGTPAGGVTLEQLATHTSGLPRLPGDSAGQTIWASVRNANPYAGISGDDVIASARSAELEKPGTFAYSNLGMALLGHAEAKAAGVPDWATLAQQRLFTPLGMTETSIVDEDHVDEPGLAAPRLSNGMATDPWATAGHDPAGASTRTTAADMATFARAILEGRAPGSDALDPRIDASKGRKVGLAWLTSTDDQGPFQWHNGGTGGASTILTIDRKKKTAAVVLGNSATNVDHIGVGLIRPAQPAPAAKTDAWTWIPLAVAVAFILGAWWKAWRAQSRIGLVGAVVDAATGAVVALTRGPWDIVPEWLLGSIVAVAFVGAVFAVARMREAPTWPAGAKWKPVLDLVVSLALLVFFALAL